MSDASIRRATPADAADIAEVFLASRSEAMPYLRKVRTDEEVRAGFPKMLFSKCDVWVGEIDGRVAGFLALTPGWVEHLYIAPAFQGRGIGSALLDKAKALHPDGLRLWTFQKNEKARRFYESRGFKAVEFTDGAGNEEREPDVRYAWRG